MPSDGIIKDREYLPCEGIVGITARIGINRYEKISYSPSTKTY